MKLYSHLEKRIIGVPELVKQFNLINREQFSLDVSRAIFWLNDENKQKSVNSSRQKFYSEIRRILETDRAIHIRVIDEITLGVSMFDVRFNKAIGKEVYTDGVKSFTEINEEELRNIKREIYYSCRNCDLAGSCSRDNKNKAVLFNRDNKFIARSSCKRLLRLEVLSRLEGKNEEYTISYKF